MTVMNVVMLRIIVRKTKATTRKKMKKKKKQEKENEMGDKDTDKHRTSLKWRESRSSAVVIEEHYKTRRKKSIRVSQCTHRLVGLVVTASASKAEDPGFESRLRRDFYGV